MTHYPFENICALVLTISVNIYSEANGVYQRVSTWMTEKENVSVHHGFCQSSEGFMGDH